MLTKVILECKQRKAKKEKAINLMINVTVILSMFNSDLSSQCNLYCDFSILMFFMVMIT